MTCSILFKHKNNWQVYYLTERRTKIVRHIFLTVFLYVTQLQQNYLTDFQNIWYE